MSLEPIRPNDIWLVQVYCSLLSQRIISSFTYRVVDPGSEADAPALCAAINTWFKSAGNMMDDMKAVTSTIQYYDFVQCQRVFPQRTAIVSSVDGDIGDLDVANMISNSAAVFTRRTVIAGRDQVSSLHMPLVQDGTYVEDGKVTTAYALAAEDLRVSLYTDIMTAGGTQLRPVIYHKGVAPDDHYSDVHAAVLQDTARVMRRRTARLGI